MDKITEEILENTKSYYELKKYSIFHQAISLIISQKITFLLGKTIRKKMFDELSLIGENQFTKENILLFDDDKLKSFGLDILKIKTLKHVCDLDYVDDLDFINKIEKIKGIGVWTIKSLMIMADIGNEFLSEDLWIRKRVSELLESNKTITITECDKLVSNIKNKRVLSRFFWRIKPEGIQKILHNKELDKNDFV